MMVEQISNPLRRLVEPTASPGDSDGFNAAFFPATAGNRGTNLGAEVRVCRARLLAALGEMDQARIDLDKAVEFDPKSKPLSDLRVQYFGDQELWQDLRYLNALGAIPFRAGEYAEAKTSLEAALQVAASTNTSSAYSPFFLAMTQHQLGNKEAARQSLRVATAAAADELAGSPPWNRKLTLELLKKEATALIGQPTEPAGEGAGTAAPLPVGN